VGGHSRPGRSRAVARLVIAAALGAVLTSTVLVGVGSAAPADVLGGIVVPGTPAPAAPVDPGSETRAPDGDAPDGDAPDGDAPDGDAPEQTSPGEPAGPELPSNPLDPAEGTPQTGDREQGADEVGPDAPEPAPEPAPPAESAVLDGGVRIPGTPCSGDVEACVDLTTRQAWLITDGQMRRGPVEIRVGSEFGPTPVGRFRVQWKNEDHVSGEFGTPMNWAVFFADGGIAFHEGRQDTDSAGCVKLTRKDAIAFFNALQVDDGVQVVRTAS